MPATISIPIHDDTSRDSEDEEDLTSFDGAQHAAPLEPAVPASAPAFVIVNELDHPPEQNITNVF